MIAERRISQEGQEGLKSFLEKRETFMGTKLMKNFKRIAIANRGEVAVRIIKACEEMGIETVLLHS